LLKVGKCSYDISISKRGNEKKAGWSIINNCWELLLTKGLEIHGQATQNI
jgi:hypothetical protein